MTGFDGGASCASRGAANRGQTIQQSRASCPLESQAEGPVRETTLRYRVVTTAATVAFRGVGAGSIDIAGSVSHPERGRPNAPADVCFRRPRFFSPHSATDRAGHTAGTRTESRPVHVRRARTWRGSITGLHYTGEVPSWRMPSWPARASLPGRVARRGVDVGVVSAAIAGPVSAARRADSWSRPWGVFASNASS